MIKLKPVFLGVLFLFLGSTGFVLGQTKVIPQIINPDEDDTISYCSDSVKVAPFISIQNVTSAQNFQGMKVAIANYRKDEDILVWNELYGFTYSWNNTYGHVEIKGEGTDQQYAEAIANVYYKNIATVPKVGIRSFSISLVDADYLPETDHFYRYIPKTGITWREARDSAANMEYFGLEGYLATIRSEVEDLFIRDKTDGTGWIGASDEKEEGRWEWVTGPDTPIYFWQNNYPNGRAINGEYNNWKNDEPNQLGDEDYCHILYNANAVSMTWNDLSNEGATSGDYQPKGFLVEFGGMPGDPDVKLSASASIQVSKIAFSDERDFRICEGDEQQLNVIAVSEDYKYTWEPNQNIDDATVLSPTVSPTQTTVYTAYGQLDFCKDSASFLIEVDPLPKTDLDTIRTYCKGSSTVLDPGNHVSYLWSNGETTRTITVSDEAEYWVKLKNEKDCELLHTVKTKWSERPVLDYSMVDTLVCGSKTQTLNLSFVNGSANTNLIALDLRATVNAPASLTPTITVSEFGKYLFKMEITDEYGCEFLDTLAIEFHNQPKAIIEMNEEKCKGYSLDVRSGVATHEDALYNWYYNDSVFQSGINLLETIIPLGYGTFDRTVGLHINEQGCTADTIVPVFVTPGVDIVVDNNEGCTPLLVGFDAKVTEAVESYLWEFGNGETSESKSSQTKFVNPELIDQKYSVALTVVSKEGCSNKGIIEDYIVVHPKPSIDLSFEESECNIQQMEIWYVGSGSDTASYYWDLSAFQADEIVQNPGTTKGPLEINRSSAPTANIGIYMQSEFGCYSDTIAKIWKRKPSFDIKVDTTEGCPPLALAAEVFVLDDVDDVSFIYDIGEGVSGSGNRVEHLYTEPGLKHQIEFIGTSSITTCSDTVVYTDTIFVYPVPKAAFTPFPEVVLITEPEVKFENESEAADMYEWDFGDSSIISTEPSPIHSFREMGYYYSTLYSYNNYYCMDSVSHRVVVAFDRIFAPTAFSPNASLDEDREFLIDSEGMLEEGYQLIIFNRWGELVFESNNPGQSWDGKMHNGDFAPSGVYAWVLEYNDLMGGSHKQKGNITLLF